MSDKATISAEIEQAFNAVPRPEHFTNFEHCEECFEHDQFLRSYTRDALTIEQIGTPASDPVTFCTPAAKAYLFPALARIALADRWYTFQLFEHLYSGYQYNEFYLFCNSKQRQAIASFLWFIIETNAELIDENNHAEEFIRCHELWSNIEQNQTRERLQ